MTAFWALLIIANMFTVAGIATGTVWPFFASFAFVGIAVFQLMTVGAA